MPAATIFMRCAKLTLRRVLVDNTVVSKGLLQALHVTVTSRRSVFNFSLVKAVTVFVSGAVFFLISIFD